MTMKKGKLGLLLTSILLMLLVAACGGGGSDSEGSAGNEAGTGEGTQAAEYKDELNVALTAQPPTLDTALTVSAVALDTAGNIFEQLYTLNAEYEPVPQLAESVERSEDGLTYTFKLRQGVKFHNGEEMTADDVVASMNRWLVTSSRAKVLLTGANFEEVDPYTVKLTVEAPTSDVLILMLRRHNSRPLCRRRSLIPLRQTAFKNTSVLARINSRSGSRTSTFIW
ncbi:ABC transporter substrate-binding protein [Paenibacillus sp. JCM 10914]|uniref:ABC transporter substrate-binding protein n=1 Tax=Paenibacillus sp. JCM 10914 TaxID=1236974 RepID=UPI0003CC5CB6|nr:ABC transporter substrate-binding protein [Paenibacillus sp. JCM 10914]GAE05954.1 peptide ABC transporter, periplasmic peptide-binding protein [Paenibacillus sp. JCM 10914]